jgi:hypothetical protein
VGVLGGIGGTSPIAPAERTTLPRLPGCGPLSKFSCGHHAKMTCPVVGRLGQASARRSSAAFLQMKDGAAEKVDQVKKEFGKKD